MIFLAQVKDFSQLEQEPVMEREDVSEYREAAWQEQVSHETMRQVSETTVTEETRKISTTSGDIEPDAASSSSSSSSDDDQEGVRSKEMKHHFAEESIEEKEQVRRNKDLILNSIRIYGLKSDWTFVLTVVHFTLIV